LNTLNRCKMSSSSPPSDPTKKRDSALGEALSRKPSEFKSAAVILLASKGIQQIKSSEKRDSALGEALPQKLSKLRGGVAGYATSKGIQRMESSEKRDSALRELLPQKRFELRGGVTSFLEELYKPIKSPETSEASCQSCITDEHISQCFLYYTLFPLGYEFEKDMLIQLWMAEGLIEERTNERLEDTGRKVFHSILCLVLFVAVGYKTRKTGNRLSLIGFHFLFLPI
jgi:hypothetical protein